MAARTLSARAYLVVALVLGTTIALLPGCTYLAKAAQGHFKLMSGRITLSEALERSDLSDDERDKLRWVPQIKSFGEEHVGLEPTRNYETINPDFNDVVWNVSGCAADRFEPHVYRYPIVGKLPYIGYFDHEDALDEERRLREMGLDTWVCRRLLDPGLVRGSSVAVDAVMGRRSTRQHGPPRVGAFDSLAEGAGQVQRELRVLCR